MATDKAPVSILMAVYEPRMDWLREQLDSLNAQTYPDLRLYIRDDCSPTVPHEEIAACVRERITAFPFTLARNEENLGSNGTFERLTREAEGELFAYCDQDDIWRPEKTAVLAAALEREDAQLVCSDMRVIDGEGRLTAESVTKVHRRQRFRSGEGLEAELLGSNFVTGTAMLIRAETAKAAVPFSPWLVHDHYLALYAAWKGRIVSLPDRLLDYRIHGGNQTGSLRGVRSKADYRERQLERQRKGLEWLQERFGGEDGLSCLIAEHLEWTEARERWFDRGGLADAREVWRGRRFGASRAAFELVCARLPEPLFRLPVRLLQKGAV